MQDGVCEEHAHTYALIHTHTPLAARFRSYNSHTHNHIQPERLSIECKVRQPPFFYLLAVVRPHSHSEEAMAHTHMHTYWLPIQ